MRKLLIILAVVFTASIFATIGVEAATATKKYKARHTISSKCSKTGKYSSKKMMSTKSKRYASKRYSSKRMSMRARTAKGPAMKCVPVRKAVRRHVLRHRVVRKAVAARVARGPIVTCPAPVVNVPQQPAPVVNVPQQPAPVVNVPPFPATVGVSTDATQIYIVRENQLMVLDKCTYEVKKVVPLQPVE